MHSSLKSVNFAEDIGNKHQNKPIDLRSSGPNIKKLENPLESPMKVLVLKSDTYKSRKKLGIYHAKSEPTLHK
jgi:hypothetical protein